MDRLDVDAEKQRTERMLRNPSPSSSQQSGFSIELHRKRKKNLRVLMLTCGLIILTLVITALIFGISGHKDKRFDGQKMTEDEGDNGSTSFKACGDVDEENCTAVCQDIKRGGFSTSIGLGTRGRSSCIHGLKIYCDCSIEEESWMVFQRRFNGEVNFNRTMHEYEMGFGNVSGEFWLGLQSLHTLTSTGYYDLRIDLMNFHNETKFAKYRQFSIPNKASKFHLHAGVYLGGTAGDALTRYNYRPFTTSYNASTRGRRGSGGWWDECSINLNSFSEKETDQYIGWETWTIEDGSVVKLLATEMKIRKIPDDS